ncbi:CRISPR-associated protein, Csm2 family [Pseudoramibacter alactolyticus ATCC 23263]|uniref:CRISPR system Cms protein Csm2 n=1 Tax=Pseudoramibacter alactolyticus ATCC 23263 TaxID=887929 RepID=E6MH33_9FIRM|nr:type III-A CRISPR-associated protein Csm2 [Pseudoramibacter alactolyticus]EFV01923.1 CRISPR-associated protein, Csm2 family [Pseudoramibacter alactolyticus ATCC 23263]
MKSINPKTYVPRAAHVIQDLYQNKQLPSTTKIRDLLAMTSSIYNEILIQRQDELSAEMVERIEYLKIRFLYEAGKDKDTWFFIKKAGLLSILDEIEASRKNYLLFSRYMEALVAFYKYFMTTKEISDYGKER